MNFLLVDDEAPARAKLRRFLADVPGVRVVGEADRGEQALALAADAALAVDAVLLDIQMPGGDGLQVAAALPPRVLVAFTTAFDEHAVRAFELNAVDYLLKPFTRERLEGCVARLRERFVSPAHAQRRQQLANALRELQPVDGHWLVTDRGATRRVALAEIECIAAADNYVELHAAEGSWLDRSTFAAFLAHPAVAGRFVRVHRSWAVQLAHVQAIAPLERGDAEIVLASGRRVRLARRWRDEVVAALRPTGNPARP